MTTLAFLLGDVRTITLYSDQETDLTKIHYLVGGWMKPAFIVEGEEYRDIRDLEMASQYLYIASEEGICVFWTTNTLCPIMLVEGYVVENATHRLTIRKDMPMILEEI